MEWRNSLLEGAIILNRKSLQVNGADASILIHYWGAQPEHYNNQPHQHSFFELCYIINGEGEYIDDGRTSHLTKGSLFLSRPFIEHQILSTTGLEIIYVAFELHKKRSTTAIIDLFAQLEKTSTFIFHDADESTVVKLWSSILLMSCDLSQFFNDSFSGLCSSFYASVVTLFNNQHIKHSQHDDQHVYSSLVYQAKLFIHDNLSHTLKINDVANYIHISERHLSRIFQKELGQSFSQYIKKERLRKASTLLSNTDLSLKEISEASGFKTVHYFTTVFSAEMGMAPGEFRNMLKQQTL
ncbi:AraC family transcriptional regulator [Paenibacillus yanchengensis]|uniref:AraC family transcriptional regulator n=1 Tax=Paenibacillus yanchengensis TaxID=2035833 RepID=A0ABW4YI43_9BACL